MSLATDLAVQVNCQLDGVVEAIADIKTRSSGGESFNMPKVTDSHINKSVKRLESYQEKCLGKRVIRDSQANAINSVFRDKSRIL